MCYLRYIILLIFNDKFYYLKNVFIFVNLSKKGVLTNNYMKSKSNYNINESNSRARINLTIASTWYRCKKYIGTSRSFNKE